MKRKRDIVTRKVYKWKVKLNVHRGQQEYGVNYLETYYPVVTWFSIITLITLAAINRWHSRQVDLVQAYPQSPIEYELYMELSKGFNTKKVILGPMYFKSSRTCMGRIILDAFGIINSTMRCVILDLNNQMLKNAFGIYNKLSSSTM